MEREVKMRLEWIILFEKIQDAGKVCRRCGISRPTLRKWLKRFKKEKINGLMSVSRRPKNSPRLKVGVDEEKIITELREKRKLGARRIQNELKRLHNFKLSLSTIHKILTRNAVKPLKRPRKKQEIKRYERPIPGDRVQMDTCKIAPGKYQYTAIDDCTRYKVLGLYPRRTAANTILFLERVIEEMPFPIQRIQTDRGREFFAEVVQKELMKYCIKFRPNKPGSPHLNGKVERAQRTDLDEFYTTIDINDSHIDDLLGEWQHQYNWFRGHGSLDGKTPMDKFFELIDKTPFWYDVEHNYRPERERIQDANYKLDLRLKKLK
jgi:transposase InsO family protein